MKLHDLFPSDRLSAEQLTERAARHLQTIFGTRLQLPGSSDNYAPDILGRTEDGKTLWFEVKQPRKDFAIGFSEISSLVNLKASSAEPYPLAVILLTGREVSEASKALLREHGIPIVHVGETAEDTRQSLRSALQENSLPVPF